MKDELEELTPKEHFINSLHRCSSNDQFVPAFYERFLASSDEIREKFRFTSFERQYKMLQRSLELSAGATDGDSDALAELKERAETHNQHNLNIKPELYDIWLDTLVLTAQEYDSQWSDTVENAWRTILGFAVRRMIANY